MQIEINFKSIKEIIVGEYLYLIYIIGHSFTEKSKQLPPPSIYCEVV